MLLGRHRIEVDHFLPWSRWPNDSIENLVLADRCNNAKSDYLAAPVHVERWLHRLDQYVPDLAAIASAARWDSDAARSLALVRSTYTHLPLGLPLWVQGAEFIEADDRLAALAIMA